MIECVILDHSNVFITATYESHEKLLPDEDLKPWMLIMRLHDLVKYMQFEVSGWGYVKTYPPPQGSIMAQSAKLTNLSGSALFESDLEH